MAGGGVTALWEFPAGVATAEAAKKFCLGGPLLHGTDLSYFCHWRPMNVSPHLQDGVFVEVMEVGVMPRGVRSLQRNRSARLRSLQSLMLPTWSQSWLHLLATARQKGQLPKRRQRKKKGHIRVEEGGGKGNDYGSDGKWCG